MNMPDQKDHVGPRQRAQIEIQDHLDISEIEMFTILFRALGFETVMDILNLKPFGLIPRSMSPVESAPPGQCPPDQPTTAADAAQPPIEPDKKIKFREWF